MTPPAAGSAPPAAPGRAVQLTLLVRAYCHLCDEMAAALAPLAAAHGATVAVVDVDGDPALEAAYGDKVPVLFAGVPAGGVELCHFRLDTARVSALLARGAGEPARRR
jgi:hypothetical protein